MKTQHNSHNSVCVHLSDCVCMCMCVCFKLYDMSAGSYLENVYKTDQATHILTPLPWFYMTAKNLQKPLNQHDNSITKTKL